jgi:hypothetical protein
VTGLAYVAVASSDAAWVHALSRPWWDDPYRFFAMATVPLAIIAGYGLAETQAWLRDRLPLALSLLVLPGFVLLSNGLYAGSNAAFVASGYQNFTLVQPGEAAAMLELGKLAKPGEWAMNDRFDGTAWTYALSGVRTVVGHFDPTLAPSDARLLAAHFREYATDPAVRAAVARLNIHWVILGKPSAPPAPAYQPGLLDLDGLPFLQVVYRNSDAVIYRLS